MRTWVEDNRVNHIRSNPLPFPILVLYEIVTRMGNRRALGHAVLETARYLFLVFLVFSNKFETIKLEELILVAAPNSDTSLYFHPLLFVSLCGDWEASKPHLVTRHTLIYPPYACIR